MYANVTGEGLAEEDVPKGRREGIVWNKKDLSRSEIRAATRKLDVSYPKFCGKVSISPSINVSAPLMVEGSSLISSANKSPVRKRLTCLKGYDSELH